MARSKDRLLRVRDWDRLYENNRSRGMKQTAWFPAPNDLSAEGYVELVAHENGAAHLGIWIALLMVASRAKPRGSLVRTDGRPHTAESLARLTRLAEQLISVAVSRLLEIGLLEAADDDLPHEGALSPHPGATNPQEAAPQPHEGATEGNGTEHHHQEEKRKGSEQQRTEPDGTQGDREASTPEHSDAPSNIGSFSPYKSDDADEEPEGPYASPDDELKAIYQTKAGEPITIEVLDAIRANLACFDISMGDFVEDVKKHIQNEWRNPAGFLRYRSKRFRAKTRVTSTPKSAAQAEAENYQCKRCASRTPGEGILQSPNGTFVPCACASPEYIARQRARGVFTAETAQCP